MPLGMEVGLGQGFTVLDEDPALPKRAQPLPIFGPCPLLPNGWMDQMLLGYREAGLRPGDVGESRVSAPRLNGSGCHLVWR